MQNKPIFIGIAAAIIIVLGAAGVFLYTKNQTSPTPNSTSVTPSPTLTSELQGSIKDIFLTAGDKQCDFSVTDDEGKTEGTFYVSGNKAAGDINVTSDGKTTATNIIRNGDTFYMWGDSFPTGIKLNVSVEELSEELGKNQSTLDPDQKVSYDCTNWTVESAKFIPPTNIKFTDLSGLSLPTSPRTTGSTSQCGACNSLTGTSKTACLTQLNCPQ